MSLEIEEEPEKEEKQNNDLTLIRDSLNVVTAKVDALAEEVFATGNKHDTTIRGELKIVKGELLKIEKLLSKPPFYQSLLSSKLAHVVLWVMAAILFLRLLGFELNTLAVLLERLMP